MDDFDNLPEPPNIRFLRRLVTTLTAVMIVGVVTIIALLVIRIQAPTPMPTLPASVDLPEGLTPLAVTVSHEDWIVVLAQDPLSGQSEVIVLDQGGQIFSRALIQTPP